MINTETLTTELTAIINKYRPTGTTDTYTRAYYAQTVTDALYLLNQAAEVEKTDAVMDIRDKNLTSAEYKIEPITLKYYVVNVDKARAGLPADVYESVMHIKSTDAVKILGRDAIKKAVIERIGAEACKKYERVNKTELEKRIPYDELLNYLDESEKSIDPDRIVKITETSA